MKRFMGLVCLVSLVLLLAACTSGASSKSSKPVSGQVVTKSNNGGSASSAVTPVNTGKGGPVAVSAVTPATTQPKRVDNGAQTVANTIPTGPKTLATPVDNKETTEKNKDKKPAEENKEAQAPVAGFSMPDLSKLNFNMGEKIEKIKKSEAVNFDEIAAKIDALSAAFERLSTVDKNGYAQYIAWTGQLVEDGSKVTNYEYLVSKLSELLPLYGTDIKVIMKNEKLYGVTCKLAKLYFNWFASGYMLKRAYNEKDKKVLYDNTKLPKNFIEEKLAPLGNSILVAALNKYDPKVDNTLTDQSFCIVAFFVEGLMNDVNVNKGAKPVENWLRQETKVKVFGEKGLVEVTYKNQEIAKYYFDRVINLPLANALELKRNIQTIGSYFILKSIPVMSDILLFNYGSFDKLYVGVNPDAKDEPTMKARAQVFANFLYNQLYILNSELEQFNPYREDKAKHLARTYELLACWLDNIDDCDGYNKFLVAWSGKKEEEVTVKSIRTVKPDNTIVYEKFEMMPLFITKTAEELKKKCLMTPKVDRQDVIEQVLKDKTIPESTSWIIRTID